jgi:D-ribose pyranose/furanose isomerase RbsD
VNVGVTTIVANIGDVPAFVAINAGIFPVPEAAKPIAVLLFVQEKVVVPPVFVVVKEAKVDELPLQKT